MGRVFPNYGATVVDTSSDLPAASADLEGLMFFQKDTNELKICDGSSWVSVSRTDAFNIDTAGRPITPLRPAFHAYLNNGGNPSAVSPVIYTQTRFNIGNHYSTSTGRFTAPIAGVYFFGASVNMYGSNSTGGIGVYIYNSANSNIGNIAGSRTLAGITGDANWNVAGLYYMQPNDYARVEISAYGTHSGGTFYNQFTGCFIG